ncbi:MAG: FCD domain-containing protein [Bacillota bacterium]|nr:FCD domain-containing protein [Bacillota bacterium]MDW7678512.1 FCD domain-containing protein [Bacillota bacterium]
MDRTYRTNASILADAIRSDIESGVLKVGDKLPPERELSKVYGLSRASVREGVRQLSTMGYVETKRNVGSFVSSTHLSNSYGDSPIKQVFEKAPVLNLMEVRLILEKNMIEYAVERATTADLDRMRAAVERISNHDTLDVFLKSDIAFHFAIVEATHNEVLIEIMRGIFKRINQNKEYFLSTSLETRHQTLIIFKKIIKCIEEKDYETAKELYGEHLFDVESALQKLV